MNSRIKTLLAAMASAVVLAFATADVQAQEDAPADTASVTESKACNWDYVGNPISGIAFHVVCPHKAPLWNDDVHNYVRTADQDSCAICVAGAAILATPRTVLYETPKWMLTEERGHQTVVGLAAVGIIVGALAITFN